MRKWKATLCLLLLLSFLPLLPARADAPFVSPRGSCDSIRGTTVIVTIFVDDPYHNWDFARPADKTSYFRIRSRLGVACEWLAEQARAYGAEATIIWDWHSHEHLYYWYTSKNDIRDYTYTYSELQAYIRDNIPLDTIKRFYGADNVVFMALYNQDIDETARGVAFALDFYPYAYADDAYEILWIMDEDNGLTVSAAGLAHELMHCFGAVDLYAASDYVTQAYVDKLRRDKSRDIMFAIDYSTPDSIGERFSALDAYYLGLTDSNADQIKYGLHESAH